MDALLGQLGMGGLGGDAPRSANGGNSVTDLQHYLHNVVASNRSETRAEHISANFEVRMNTALYIVDKPEANPANPLEQLLDPVPRTVIASETVLNQPTDDPKLQRLVAKHLAEAMGEVEGSTWTVRQVSRSTQGWKFTYQCKHSLQAWNRQNAKNSGRPPIGAFSGHGGLDSVNLSRPAFDCRGALTIAFSKSSRAIVVTYEHTPLHQTVAQLVDRLLPTILPPPPVANGNTPSANRSTKAKRPPPADGEESGRKKRKQKATNGTGNTRAERATQPQALEAALIDPQATPVLNIPPLEAVRRTEHANSLLIGKGIAPETLSAEQFSIFSNQAPHLQDSSLEMLAKYGAERLRIVHPDEKDQPASSPSTPTQQGTPTNGAVGASTPATDTPSKKRKSRKQKSGAAVIDDGETAAGDTSNISIEATSQVKHPSRYHRTRGSCNTCRLAKRKCSKEHPQCSVCHAVGETCVYLAPMRRGRKSEISAEVIENEEDSEIAEDDKGQTSHAPPAPEPSEPILHVAQIAPTVPIPDDDEFIPDANILSGPISQHPPPVQPQEGPPPYYQHGDTKVAHVQEPSSQPEPQQHAVVMSALNFSQPQAHDNVQQSSSRLTFSNTETRPAQASPELSLSTPTVATPPARETTSRNSRRSIPIAPNAQARTSSNTVQVQPVSSWSSNPHSPALTGQAHAQKQSAARPSSRRSGVGSNSPAFDGFQAAAVLSQTPIPVPRQTEVPATIKFPFQNPAQKSPSRAKSSQGQRPQTRTPVTQTPVSPPVIPTSHNTASNKSFHTPVSSSNTTPVPAYDPFSRYNNTTNDQYSQTADGHSNRIPYGPHSYTQTSTSTASNAYATPPYDYPRSSTSNNPLTQALHGTSDYGNINSSSAGQWTAQNRAAQSNTPSNTDSSSYKAGNHAQTSPSHSHGTRSAQRQPATQSTAFDQAQQQQQHHYGSYPQQSSGTEQQPSQNWYGFTSTDNNSTNHTNYGTNSRNAAYDQVSSSVDPGYNQGQRSNASEFNGYGQDLYELLRANSNH